MRRNEDKGSSSRQGQAAVQGIGAPQSIWVFEQNGSAQAKIHGIRKFGGELFSLEIVSIDAPLPTIIDDAEEYLPGEIRADLVLDFLRHPDISQDLAAMCSRSNIPVVASGKKLKVRGAFTPLT